MRLYVEPMMSAWRLGPQAWSPRISLAAAANLATLNMSTANRSAPQPLGGDARRVIATGHQAWFWHPGILAKYIAATVAAKLFTAAPLAVVVDQDVHAALHLDIPIRHDDRLSVQTIELAPYRADLPTGAQPAADPAVVLRTLKDIHRELGNTAMVDLQPLMAAWIDLPPAPSLADQVSLVLDRLMSPYAGPMAKINASDLLALPEAKDWLLKIVADARRCAECYNHAVAEYPAAGIEPLIISPHEVELPVWLLRHGSRRQRTYVTTQAASPQVVADDGRQIHLPLRDAESRLAPRALLLTAIMRRCYCDIFIHGRGGALYDRVAESWWRQWTNEELSPMTVVSADMFLPLTASTAAASDLVRAKWLRHHMPHNIDRFATLSEAELALHAQKCRILTHMNDDRNRSRRTAAFAEIHQINNSLVANHRNLLDAAIQAVTAIQIGVANAKIIGRRDWCFALYSPEQLTALREAIVTNASA